MSEPTKFIFIDTNLWINLATEQSYIEQLKKIREVINFPNFRLVLPDSVKIEFNRHRSSIIKKWQESLKSQVANSYKVFRMLLPNREAELKNLLETAQNCIKTGFEQVQTNLSLIDELFSLAQVASTSLLMEKAALRCLHHTPPAAKSTRSSVGDCLLWLSAIDYLDRGEVWFCTDNRGDFSEQKREDILNLDLQSEAASKTFPMTYFTDPNKMIEAALPYRPKLPDYINFTITTQSLELVDELVRTMKSLSNFKIPDLTTSPIAPELAAKLAREIERSASIKTIDLGVGLIAPALASKSLKRIPESIALKSELVQTVAEQLKKVSTILAPELASKLAKEIRKS